MRAVSGKFATVYGNVYKLILETLSRACADDGLPRLKAVGNALDGNVYTAESRMDRGGEEELRTINVSYIYAAVLLVSVH